MTSKVGVRLLTVAAVLILLAVLRGFPETPLGAAVSPTGRSPKLLWTAERQAVWSRMKADYDSNRSSKAGQWYDILKKNAECACKYGDNGMWATVMYQITGEAKYVTLAWARLQRGFLKASGRALVGNYAREYSHEMVVMYDWLFPGLSPNQRQEFLAKLNEMFSLLAAGNQYTKAMPIRTSDTDQTVGSYFGFAFLVLATGDHNPTAHDLFGNSFIGGLDATGTGRTTLRNAIKGYVTELAAGGEWMESSDYNLGTVRLLALGAEGVKTATGVDHFPEVTAFLDDAALRQVYMLTPDRKSSVQWGDEQTPRGIASRLFSWQTTNGILAGLTQSDAESGPYIQKLVHDLADQYGMSGYLSAEPWARFFLLFNPYARAAATSALPLARFSPGQGMLVVRDGWTENSTLVAVHMPTNHPNIDHQVSYFGDFQMYRKGTWALTHPISYAGPSLRGDGTNTMLIGSFSSMAQFKRVTAHEHGAGGAYTYIAGTTGGQKSAEGAYDPPPTFLHEWTRSIVYLPSSDQRSDTLVVYDRTNAQNPTNLPKFERYRRASPDEQSAILDMPALKQWVIHMPVDPMLSSESISWNLPDGQHVTVDTLLPQPQRRVVYDERILWRTRVPPAERKWQVRILPTVERQWDTFLNVVQVFDSGANLANTLLRSDDRSVEGVQVRRGGHNDVVALFNGETGPALPDIRKGALSVFDTQVKSTLDTARLRPGGYTVRWTSTSAATDVLIFDLDRSRNWRVSIDGRPAAALKVSGQGVGSVAVQGTGAHSVNVVSN
ncbi:MAG TPA: hypothetical protein VFS23_00340 [Vicinamibacterales bacterium]|nr:hypothetical protein [Vicinamibacterales bacterium]